MKLDFKILWIDDERKDSSTSANLDRIKSNIEQKLESDYFRADIKPETGDVNLDNFPYNSEEYDLFLIDFTIGEKKGSDCIKKIRADGLYTDIIFYSQDDIERKVKDYLNEDNEIGDANHFLEGVFLSKRDELSTKFGDILDIIDRKVNNLYSMRGLVLAETADIDYILCEIINKLFDRLGIEKNNTCLAKKNPDLGGRDFDKGNIHFDGSKSRSFTDRLMNRGGNEIFIAYLNDSNSPILSYIINDNNYKEFKTMVDDYRCFYANKRNPLAHKKTEINNLTKSLKAGNIEYSIQEMKDMRKTLIKFKDFFGNYRDGI